MATGQRGEKRSADVVGCAVAVARLFVGDMTEEPKQPSGKTRSGHVSAKARAERLMAEQRREIARRAAAGRWR
jgi:hypothetical protein